MILPQWLWAVCLAVFVSGRGAMGLELKADDEGMKFYPPW